MRARSDVRVMRSKEGYDYAKAREKILKILKGKPRRRTNPFDRR